MYCFSFDITTLGMCLGTLWYIKQLYCLVENEMYHKVSSPFNQSSPSDKFSLISVTFWLQVSHVHSSWYVVISLSFQAFTD